MKNVKLRSIGERTQRQPFIWFLSSRIHGLGHACVMCRICDGFSISQFLFGQHKKEYNKFMNRFVGTRC